MKQILYILIFISYPIYCSEKITGKRTEIPISKLEEHLEIKIHNSQLVFQSKIPVHMNVIIEYRSENSGKIEHSILKSKNKTKTHEFSYIATDQIEEYEPLKDLIRKRYKKQISLYHKEIYNEPIENFTYLGSFIKKTIILDPNFLENNSIHYNLNDISMDLDQKQVIFEQKTIGQSDDRFIKIYIMFTQKEKLLTNGSN